MIAPGREDNHFPQVYIINVAVHRIAHVAAHQGQYKLIIRVRVYNRLAVLLVGIPTHGNLTTFQLHAGAFLRQKLVLDMWYFLDEHGGPSFFDFAARISGERL